MMSSTIAIVLTTILISQYSTIYRTSFYSLIPNRKVGSEMVYIQVHQKYQHVSGLLKPARVTITSLTNYFTLYFLTFRGDYKQWLILGTHTILSTRRLKTRLKYNYIFNESVQGSSFGFELFTFMVRWEHYFRGTITLCLLHTFYTHFSYGLL